MDDLTHISPIPIIVCGCFIAGGLFLDAEASIPLWMHRSFEVAWISIWGCLAIFWVIVESRYKSNAR